MVSEGMDSTREVLAPYTIKFYKQDWTPLTNDINGSRNGGDGIMITISKITMIPTKELVDFIPGMHGLRERLSWASHRTTTRIEDLFLDGYFGCESLHRIRRRRESV